MWPDCCGHLTDLNTAKRMCQCTVEAIKFFAQLSVAVKIELGLESHPLAKQPFLTAFCKTHGPTKLEELGTWQASILFRILWPFFFVLYRGTLG